MAQTRVQHPPMPAHPIELPISLAWGKGGYTVQVRLGHAQTPLNLVLDTGSSTLAILPGTYAADLDPDLQSTAMAQAVAYGAGAFAGPVLKTSLRFGAGHHARTLHAVDFALVQSPDPPWQDADGLLGLAYDGLNLAHDATALFPVTEPPITRTWPWPFALPDSLALARFRQQLLAQPAICLKPCFSALEEEGLVPDCFALLVRRAVVHVAQPGASLHQLAADPLNQGTLVLGGGPQCASLHEGGFKTLKVVHDRYYNVLLKTIRVGAEAEICAPPLAPQDIARYCSNAIVDTGSSFLILPETVYAAVLAAFARIDPRLAQTIAQFNTLFATGHGLPNDVVRALPWPVLHFTLEGADGADVGLKLNPAQYWENNALNHGEALFLLRSQIQGWAAQSILGLPLWCGQFLVFDRSVGQAGVIRVAKASQSP